MWLLPVLSGVSTVALHTFYRLSRDGRAVPREGPVLLVTNHPNSLLDPALVASAANRPVRFLAKAPLFTDPSVGWLVRASGAVPVYRKADDPSLMERNEDTFRAVHSVLASGAAVGIFPEGLSHSEPSLAPIRTGAARIALGAALLTGGSFPIIPVGLTFRGKERFRSEAIVLVGEQLDWDDLADAGPEAMDAVRELTERVESALRRITINVQRWEDALLVETAEAIYSAEYATEPGAANRIARVSEASDTLARLRGEERGAWSSLARDVATHARLLRVLGLEPRDLESVTSTRVAANWVVRQIAFFLIGAPIAAAGALIFLIPYRLTGMMESRARPAHDIRATYKVLVGALLHMIWIVLVALVVGLAAGGVAAVTTAIAMPLVGIVTVHVFDRWGRAVGEARRFWLRTRLGDTVRELQNRQREIAARLRQTWEATRDRSGSTV